MASLAQLLASHGRILVLDAASTRVQVGLLQPSGGCWHAADTEAGQALFAGTAAVLREAGVSLDDAGAFVFCEGPGSMLGTRTVAMALRSWLVLRDRPVFAYQSLALAAAGEYERARRAFSVIADARRDAWHCQRIAADGTRAVLQRLPVAELPSGELLTPAHFRAWSPAPAGTGACGYAVERLWAAAATRELLRAVPAPDALHHEAPDYKRWSARVHSAETAPRR